jgi:hypothetical protein
MSTPHHPPNGIEALCLRAVQEAGVDGAGVSMLSRDGTPDPVFATDVLSALVEDLQFTLGVGPCFDAVATQAPVLVGDLTNPDQEVADGPFRDEAASAGIRAVFAVPVGVAGRVLGTLDLYRGSPGPLSSSQLRRTLATADAIGGALLDGGALPPNALEHVRHRAAVHQAAGMVMMQMDVSIEEALLVLRATAYAEGTSINELAAALVDGRRRFAREQV